MPSLGQPSISGMLRMGGMGGGIPRMSGVSGVGSMLRVPGLASSMRMPSIGTGYLHGMSIGSVNALNQAVGVNLLKKPPQDVGIPSDESKLQTFLTKISRTQFATDSAATELFRQMHTGQFDAGAIKDEAVKGLKLNPEGMKSGSNVLTAVGFPENPSSFAGAFTKASLGAAWDFLVNPLNLVHIGVPTKLGKTFETKGTGIIPGKPALDVEGKPIPAQGMVEGRVPLSDLGQPGGWGDQLTSGLRTAVKIGPIEAPDFLNKIVGHAMNYLGAVLHATPLVGPMIKAFGENKLNYLRPHFETLDFVNREIKNPNKPWVKKMEEVGVARNSAVDAVKKGLPLLDPIHDAKAQSEGFTTPEDRVHHAAIRYMEQGKVQAQPFLIDDLNKEAAQKTWIADALESGKVPPTLDKVSRRYIRALQKQPDEVRQSAIESLRRDALVKSTVRDELQFKQDYPEKFSPEIQKLGSFLKDVNEKDVMPSRQYAGAKVLPMEEYGTGRTLTQEARAAYEKYQGGKPQGGRGGRIWDQASYNQKRVLGELTLDQANTLFNNPVVKKKYMSSFGMNPLQKEDNILSLIGIKSKTPSTLFKTDPVAESWHRLIDAKQAENSLNMMKDVKDQFGFDSEKDYWDSGASEPPSLAKIPPQFQKAFGGKESFLADPRIAEEFNQHVVPLVEPKNMNKVLKQLDTARFLLQKITLFGIPLYSGATAVRNFFGHGFFSALRGAVSPEGMAGALSIAKTKMAHEMGLAGPKSWDEVKAAMPKKWGRQGLDLGQIADDMDKSGQTKAGMYLMNMADKPTDGVDVLNRFADKIPFGPTFGAKLDNFMSYLIRTQHYISRLKQGWEGGANGAAMRDVKESMIDYSPRALGAMDNKIKRLFLFYSFVRFNMPLMMQAILQQPGKIVGTNMALKNIEDIFGQPQAGQQKPDERFLDEFIKGNLHVRLFQDKNKNWNYFVLKNWLPLADMEDLMSGHGIAEKALSSLNPALKLLYEQASGVSSYFQKPGGGPQPLERFPGEQGALLGFPVSKRVESAVKGVLRPVNAMDQFNPFDLFGQSKQMTPEGGYRASAPLTTGEKVSAALAFRMRPYDEQRGQAQAQYQFRQMFDTYRNAILRAAKVGDLPNVQAGMSGIRDVMQRAAPIQRLGQ